MNGDEMKNYAGKNSFRHINFEEKEMCKSANSSKPKIFKL